MDQNNNLTIAYFPQKIFKDGFFWWHTILNLMLAVLGIVLNYKFFIYIYRTVLMNINLKCILLSQAFFAFIASLAASISGIRIFIVFKIVKIWDVSSFSCALINAPFKFAVGMTLALQLLISFERSVASLKYVEYFQVKNLVYSYLGIFMEIISALIMNFFDIQTSIREPAQVCLHMKIEQPDKLMSKSKIMIVCMIVCMLTNAANILLNKYWLKKLLWYNRGTFNLQTRLQLQKNIKTNRAIMGSLICYLFTFALLILTIRVYLKSNTEAVDVIWIMEFNATLYIGYCSLWSLPFLAVDTDFVTKLVTRIKGLLKKYFLDGKNMVHPIRNVNQQKVMVTEKYFIELKNAWK